MKTNLVGGFNPSEKYESQWEGLSHDPMYYGKCKKFQANSQLKSTYHSCL
jgi:hypothetical protein